MCLYKYILYKKALHADTKYMECFNFKRGYKSNIPMQDQQRVRMPTGIASLDPVLDGGIPPGSVVLLLGENGAGATEFAYSSIIYLSLLKGQQSAGQRVRLPEEITYITFTKLKENILSDVAISFQTDHSERLREAITFVDLSELYFDATIVPPDWYGEGDIITRLQKRQRKENGNILAELTQVLGRCKPGGLIVLDSLTGIASGYKGDDWYAFIALLRGIQRVSKRWKTTVYLHLTAGILNPSQETEIADCADALVLFKWEDMGAQRRQRIMFFEKFQGVMPYLEERDLVKFAVKLSAAGGFEVRNIRVVV
jgi:KaiC/GvpD/RAD55 family RecA-like ATPase